MKSKIYLLLFLLFSSASVFAQGSKEYGDAPEGVLAYPANGVIGAFPTCLNVAVAGCVQHTNFGAYFLSFDLEPEGNQGLCPMFSPYDHDECFADGDAGLILPQPFTIAGSRVVTCPASAGQSLGGVCQMVVWGQMIDINVTNFMPNQAIGYVNLVIDWNQDGDWGDMVICPQGNTPEHVLVNFPVPNGYSGVLSMLGPPNFAAGPNTGFVWARFTISEKAVPVNWNGDGTFEDGESEDYLIYIGDFDYGDAPEGSVAYPYTSVIGQFPTCVGTGSPNSYIQHYLGGSKFSPNVDPEQDGNAGVCPVFTPNQYDRDECFQDGDAGLILPRPYTIAGATGNEQVVPCSQSGTSLGDACQNLVWGTDIDINVSGPGYVNVLMDWNQDGKWQYGATVTCYGQVVPEHVLVNFYVTPGVTISAPLSSFFPPSFTCGPYHGFVWTRFSITDTTVGMNWDGSGVFYNGETEDYLLAVDDSITGINRMQPGGWIRMSPNPWDENGYVEFFLKSAGKVAITLTDMLGNKVSGRFESQMPYGYNKIPADRVIPAEGIPATGIYLMVMTLDGEFAGCGKVLIRR